MIKPIVFNYPIEHQYDLNIKLHKLLLAHSTERLGGFKKKGKRLQGGRRTPWDLHRRGIKEFDELAGWIKSILPRVASHFARLKKGEKCSFVVEALEITHMWGVIYDKGDSVYPHNHFPFSVSFGYYVHTPKGCSALKIENKKYAKKRNRTVCSITE